MNALGELLRARRELVSPKDEGISADYYLRLEFGHTSQLRHPRAARTRSGWRC